MIVELVAGRIIAPYVGVSLYTWTSIIGVVLAGISLGNFLGGEIAEVQSCPYKSESSAFPTPANQPCSTH